MQLNLNALNRKTMMWKTCRMTVDRRMMPAARHRARRLPSPSRSAVAQLPTVYQQRSDRFSTAAGHRRTAANLLRHRRVGQAACRQST